MGQIDIDHPVSSEGSLAPGTSPKELIFFEPKCPPHTSERKLMLKVDFRLLPILILIYILAFLDRVNISNALTLGLPQELHLNDVTDQQSNIALAIFFVPYVIFEIPANWLMKRFSPHIWLSGCITFFGAFMLGQGFVKNYSALLATRFFLGFAEAGIFAGCFYLISFYYKRSESQTRFTWFFQAVTLAAALGSLIASGIANMGNARGLSSWRWIFIIEGALTMFFGILSYWIIVDFPATASWLRDDEREYIIARTQVELEDDAQQTVTCQAVRNFFKHPKKVLGAFMYFSSLIPLYSFAYFAPTIIKQLNLSTVQTQLHTVPPFAAALVFSIGLSMISDRLQSRFPFLVLASLLSIAGTAMLQSIHTGFSARYAALFLVIMGSYTAGPMIICWCTMNLHGHVDRAVGTAWIIGFGNIGGLIATFLFPVKQGPLYTPGYGVCQMGACLGLVTSAIYYLLCARENKKLQARGGKTLNML